ncbi:MAG: 3-deoxy-D-manno-octulosonic acid transferase [Cyclobacteriaceae bacterium]
MRYLYDLNLWLYQLLLALVALWHPRAKRFIQSRKGIFESLRIELEKNTQPTIWLHLASLGEYEQALPIITSLKSERPEHLLLITFYSPSGYEVVKRSNTQDLVHYLPFDSHQNASKFLDLVKPELAIFIKYELWYHYLIQIRKRQIPAILISAVFRKNQFYFEPYGYFFKKAFQAFDHFFVQNEESLALLSKYGFENVTLAGDTRFDRVMEIANSKKPKLELSTLKTEKFTIVLGSIWSSDLGILNDVILSLREQVRFIIATHHIDENALAHFDHLSGTRFSTATPTERINAEILILDTMGMLSSVYSIADITIVGGGSRGALHNILEPAAHGKPVLFQQHSNNSKFLEVKGILDAKGGFDFASQEELQVLIDRLISDLDFRETIGKNSRKFVSENAGATQKIMSKIAEIV